MFQRAKERGASVVSEPQEEKDEFGAVVTARVRTYGDTTHTFIDKSNYKGWFMPGFTKVANNDPLLKLL